MTAPSRQQQQQPTHASTRDPIYTRYTSISAASETIEIHWGIHPTPPSLVRVCCANKILFLSFVFFFRAFSIYKYSSLSQASHVSNKSVGDFFFSSSSSSSFIFLCHNYYIEATPPLLLSSPPAWPISYILSVIFAERLAACTDIERPPQACTGTRVRVHVPPPVLYKRPTRGSVVVRCAAAVGWPAGGGGSCSSARGYIGEELAGYIWRLESTTNNQRQTVIARPSYSWSSSMMMNEVHVAMEDLSARLLLFWYILSITLDLSHDCIRGEGERQQIVV